MADERHGREPRRRRRRRTSADPSVAETPLESSRTPGASTRSDAARPTASPSPTPEAHSVAQHHRQHASRRGAERDANADLLRPLRDGVGHDAVDADGGEEQGDGGEDPRISISGSGAVRATRTRARRAVDASDRLRRIELASTPRPPPARAIAAGSRSCAGRIALVGRAASLRVGQIHLGARRLVEAAGRTSPTMPTIVPHGPSYPAVLLLHPLADRLFAVRPARGHHRLVDDDGARRVGGVGRVKEAPGPSGMRIVRRSRRFTSRPSAPGTFPGFGTLFFDVYSSHPLSLFSNGS